MVTGQTLFQSGRDRIQGGVWDDVMMGRYAAESLFCCTGCPLEELPRLIAKDIKLF